MLYMQIQKADETRFVTEHASSREKGNVVHEFVVDNM